MSENLTPVTREEMFMANAAGASYPLTPVTRKEMFLQNIADAQGGGGAPVPTPTAADNGKVIGVVGGAYVLVGQDGTYKAFPSTWASSLSGTTAAFCATIDADATAKKGEAYLGEVTLSDLPASISNAEVVVEIMDGTGTSGKVIHLVLTSGNVSPYRWEYTYWNNGSNVSGWVAFETTANKVTSISAQSTDTQYPTAKCVYDLVEPNPTLAGTEALLAGLGVNGTKYKIPDEVEGNPTVPSGTTPTALANLRIGNNYFSAGGGGDTHLYEYRLKFNYSGIKTEFGNLSNKAIVSNGFTWIFYSTNLLTGGQISSALGTMVRNGDQPITAGSLSVNTSEFKYEGATAWAGMNNDSLFCFVNIPGSGAYSGFWVSGQYTANTIQII